MPKTILISIIITISFIVTFCIKSQTPIQIKLGQSRLRSIISKSSFKQEQTSAVKALYPKFKAIKDLGPSRITSDMSNGLPVIEMYARLNGTGPWLRYEDTISTKEQAAILQTIEMGGIQGELSKTYFDEGLAESIFGLGTRIDHTTFTRIKANLPNLKKIKQKDMEIGYKVASLSGTIISSVKRPVKLNPSLSNIQITEPLELSLNEKRDLTIRYTNESVVDITSLTSRKLDSWVESFVEKLKDLNTKSFVVYSDGSASVSGRGTLCLRASGGIYIIPTVGDGSYVFEKAQSLRVTDVASVAVTPFDAELFAGLSSLVISKLISKARCAVDNTATTCSIVTDSKSLRKTLLTDPPSDPPGHISGTESATGVDATSGGLRGLQQTGSMRQRVKSRIIQRGPSRIMELSALDVTSGSTFRSTSATMAPVSTSALTTSPNKETSLSEAEVLQASEPHLMFTAPIPTTASSTALTNRWVLWTLAAQNIKRTRQFTDTDISIKWVNGHPERRQEDSTLWTDAERAIWAADMVASVGNRGMESYAPPMLDVKSTLDVNTLDLLRYAAQS